MPPLKTYLRLLSYAPRDREYEAAKKWLPRAAREIKANGLTRARELFGIGGDSANLLSPETMRNLLEIATATDGNPPSVSELAALVPTRATDSIHLPELQRLIEETLALMKISRDPLHDTAHIVRTVRFASLICKKLLQEHETLDWGTIVAALSWHDVYRVKNLGFLYNKNTPLRRALRKIPWLIDIDIYTVFRKDSIGSAIWFLKTSKRRLPKHLRRKIAIAILGEHSLNAFQESFYPGISLYKNIVFSADTLDLASAARLHNGWQRVLEQGLMDIRWYNRLLVLNILFELSSIELHPSFAIARDFYSIIKRSTHAYVSRFFPTDAKLFSEHVRLVSQPQE